MGEHCGASRRAVLAVGAVGTAGALAGCQVYGRPEPAPPPPPAGAEGSGDAAGAAVVANAADVDVGGGLIVDEQNLVITQPVEGDFRAFSATCTHQGCTVNEVTDGVIVCNCHGSRFSIEDGSVVQAAQGLSPDQQQPLPQVGITVDGDAITLG